MAHTRWLVVAVSLAVLSSCSSNGDGSKASTLSLQLREYQITPASSTAKAGEVTFKATNTGGIEHELVVFKTDLAPDKLPVKGDIVDEEGAGLQAIDEIAEFAAGKTESKAMTLTAGSYVLICNVETHYAQGMRATLTVT